MKIGTAVGSAFYSNADTCSSYDMILKNDFNILVAENEMKYDAIEPNKGVFNFSKPDIHVNYAADQVKWLAYQAEDYRKLICICLD